jgi:hypothetical protein
MIGGLRLFSSNTQPHSFSKRHFAAIALMLDEEEKKNAALSDKRSVCGFTSVSEAKNQKTNAGPCTKN